MPTYRCFIRGENFPGSLTGERARVGFFATRFIEAASPQEAEDRALALLRTEQIFTAVDPAARPSDAKVYFEQIEAIEIEPGRGPGAGFSFFPMIERPALAATVLPPLLLLWPASTTHGPALVLALALLLLVGLYCVFRLGWLLLHPDRPWMLMARPALALAICAGVVAYAQASLAPARRFAEDTVAALQRECAAAGAFPVVPAGWAPRDDAINAQTFAGDRVKWPLHYVSDGRTFEITLYQGPDIGERWSSGSEACGAG